MIDDDDGVEVFDEDYGDDVDDDEEMINISIENVQNLDDQFNIGLNGSEKERENREDGVGKKVDWREIMQKILNKIKVFVFDVFQQIQDIWKQVGFQYMYSYRKDFELLYVDIMSYLYC